MTMAVKITQNTLCEFRGNCCSNVGAIFDPNFIS